MNRLISPQPAISSPSKSTTITQTRSARPISAPLRTDQPHCLMVPQHYERNYAYPLLVWLHDCGGTEQELKQIVPLISLRNYVSLAVRGTCELGRGFGWGDCGDSLLAAESRVADAVSHATQRFNVHRRRVFLAGAGNGGTMALRLALRSPDQYAGGASIGGCFPRGANPLAQLAAARESRLLLMHCRDSVSYTVERVCEELSLFHAAGMSVTVRQYPCPDELTTQMLRDLDVWLMEQVTGVRSDEAQPTPLTSEWN